MIDPKIVARRPEDVGVDATRLEALFARAQRDIDERRLPSAQIAVAREGTIAGLRTFGSALHGDIEKPATDETLYCIFSSTKGIFAVCIWMLIGERLLRIDERVADIIPEFASNGKQTVTVEQLLIHAGG